MYILNIIYIINISWIVFMYIYIFVSFIPITSGANHKPAHGLLLVAGGADERWRCLLAQLSPTVLE